MAAAQAADFIYETNPDNTLTITKYTGLGGAVVIPFAIGGKTVTRIEVGAFRYSSSITSLTIGNGITSIGSDAFYACACLMSVTIPDSVTSIGEAVFERCTSLTSVTIGSGVTSGDGVISIKDGAFSFCTSLTGVYFKGNAPSIGLGVFDGDDNAIVYYLPGTMGWGATFGGRPTAVWNAQPVERPAALATAAPLPISRRIEGVGVKAGDFACTTNSDGALTVACYNGLGGAVVIPATIDGKTVSIIGQAAFENCPRLTSVMIGNSVTSIEYGAFSSCTALIKVTIGNGVTSIGNLAFYDCPCLTSVTIGHSVTNIGDNAFAVCTSLTGVHFKGNAPSIGSGVFYYDDDATVYYLPGTTGWGTTFGGRPTAVWKP